MSKNVGKKFEEDFFKSFPDDHFVYRLRDSAGAWGGENENSRFTPTNICDFIVAPVVGTVLLLELKTTKGKSLPFGNIKKHQIKGMYNANQYKGVTAYFIINFRELSETYAIEADFIKSFYEEADRKSFPINFFRDNGIKIEGTLKRVRYRYNVSRLLGIN